MRPPKRNATGRAVYQIFGSAAAVFLLVTVAFLLASCASCDPVHLGCAR